jgi:predicted phosphodiesterase
MRVAIVTDIHGNRRALQAVLADLKQVAPDLILHGGGSGIRWDASSGNH